MPGGCLQAFFLIAFPSFRQCVMVKQRLFCNIVVTSVYNSENVCYTKLYLV